MGEETWTTTKVRCMLDDMIRDTREARDAIKLSGGGNQPPTDVDQLKLKEMTSDFAKETSEGGSDTSPVQMLAESLSAIVETLNSASKGKSTGKGKTTACGGQPLAVAAVLSKQEGPVKNRRGKSRAKAGVEARPKARGKGLTCYVCGGNGHPRGCAPVKDVLTTWSRSRLKERTPMMTVAGRKRTTTHSNWYLCSESCLTSSPPGLRDAFSEAGWTVVIRKSRKLQRCSKDRLGSLISEESSLEPCQDHQGSKSSLLGRGQGLCQEQQDNADHKPLPRAQRTDA